MIFSTIKWDIDIASILFTNTFIIYHKMKILLEECLHFRKNAAKIRWHHTLCTISTFHANIYVLADWKSCRHFVWFFNVPVNDDNIEVAWYIS